jgi:hypothetical protein
LLVEQASIISEGIIAGKRSEEELQMFLNRNQSELHDLHIRQQLAEAALAQGTSIDEYIAAQAERMRSDVRVSEHERKTHIDLENRWKEILQDLNAADLESIATRQVAKKIRDELVEARRERHSIEQGLDPPAVKEAILKDYDNYITNVTRQYHAIETRLLQEADWKDAGGETERATDGRAGSPKEIKATEE